MSNARPTCVTTSLARLAARPLPDGAAARAQAQDDDQAHATKAITPKTPTIMKGSTDRIRSDEPRAGALRRL